MGCCFTGGSTVSISSRISGSVGLRDAVVTPRDVAFAEFFGAFFARVFFAGAFFAGAFFAVDFLTGADFRADDDFFLADDFFAETFFPEDFFAEERADEGFFAEVLTRNLNVTQPISSEWYFETNFGHTGFPSRIDTRTRKRV